MDQDTIFNRAEVFGGVRLDKENEWVKLAAMIPWAKFENEYANLFPSKRGQPACSVRMALGALIIKQRYGFSDEDLTSHIAMNPYLQFFLGIPVYQMKAPFHSSMVTRFRKRITPQMLQELNDIIIGRPCEKKEDSKDDDTGEDSGKGSGGGTGGGKESDTAPAEAVTEGENEGTLILDATCAPQNIRFPRDISLLDEARRNAEEIIDSLHENKQTEDGKKPRTYREKAKREFNSYSKARKKSIKQLKKAMRRQLGYLGRDLSIIEKIAEKHPEYRKFLTKWQDERLQVIRTLYEQQKTMFEQGVNRIEDRIVSLSQPWVRPIKRGKQNADTEFGAKVEMSNENGYLRIEELRWSAFNESTTLKESAEKYRKAYGHYPLRILADKIFRTRENINYCKEHGIHLNGPRLGKPIQDEKLRKEEEHQEWIESGERGDIERRFGIAKRVYSLDKITAKLKHTSEIMIYMSVLTLNLQKKLRLLLYAFLCTLSRILRIPAKNAFVQ